MDGFDQFMFWYLLIMGAVMMCIGFYNEVADYFAEESLEEGSKQEEPVNMALFVEPLAPEAIATSRVSYVEVNNVVQLFPKQEISNSPPAA